MWGDMSRMIVDIRAGPLLRVPTKVSGSHENCVGGLSGISTPKNIEIKVLRLIRSKKLQTY